MSRFGTELEVQIASLRRPPVRLVGFDGLTASRWLKESPATAHIPIIALSGRLTAREEARAAGCDGFLAKPCLLEVLSWEIQALLNPPS